MSDSRGEEFGKGNAGVYVLELEGGNYYVGWSSNLDVRLAQHKAGGSDSSAWTRLHKFIRVIEYKVGADKADEQILTLQYMRRYGLDKVRGGSYCKVVLESVPPEFEEGKGLCYGCKKSDHFLAQCPEKDREREQATLKREASPERTVSPKRQKTVYLAPSSSSSVPSNMTAKRQKTVDLVRSSSSSFPYNVTAIVSGFIAGLAGSAHDRQTGYGGVRDHRNCCHRCGRKGHWSDTCYAKRDIDGNHLSEWD
jgi:hypothetical protein